MGKKSGLVDKLVAKKKKKRELCLDLNSGSGMFVNKTSTNTSNLVDSVLKVKQVNNSMAKKLKPAKPITNRKGFTMFNIDNNILENKLNLDTLKFNNDNILPDKKGINKLLDSKSINSKHDNGKHDNGKHDNNKSVNIENINNNEYNKKNNEHYKKNNVTNISNISPKNIVTESITNNIIPKPEKTNCKDINKIGKEKDNSRFSNSSIIKLSKKKYGKLIDKGEAIQKKIEYINYQVEKMKTQKNELDYIKKIDDEKKKLFDLEKKLKKIELIKFLHQKKISIEKYKQNIEQYQNMINNKHNNINEFNNIKKIKQKSIKQSNNDNSNKEKFKLKMLNNSEYNIDIINKTINSRNILYKQIINKYKNNLICIKNIEKNKYELTAKYYLTNINKLIKLLDISEKYWNTLYDTSIFNFSITIK